MMKNLKILLIVLAISLSSVVMSQTVIVVEPDVTYRVMCWSDGDGGHTLDEGCDINLNGDYYGNNQDTLKIPIGTTCEVEAGSEGDYYSYSWMGIWDTYTITIEDEGSWFVSKLSNVTGHTYVGHFWVKYYDPTDVVDLADEIDMLVYPNPATDFLMIKYDRDIQWELMSISGQVLITGSSKRINLNSLSKGYYVMKIITAEGVVNKKILKQ